MQRRRAILPAAAMAVSIAVSLAWIAPAADWLNFRGDPDLSGWQRHEKIVTPENVSRLKLIWKLKLSGDLRTPVILGHWITHRGTKELIFAASSAGHVYAVDADLGRLFWERTLDSGSDGCPAGLTAAPVLAPGPPPPPGQTETEDDDDVQQSVRPIYVVGANGNMYRLHPTTGEDFEPPLPFLPARTEGFAPFLRNGKIFAETRSDCGVGAPGELAFDVQGGTAATVAPVLYQPDTATWKDGWTFRAGRSAVEGFRGDRRVWTSPAMILPAPPVVANGVTYGLSRGSKNSAAVLYALDARTGAVLYSSGTQTQIQGSVSPGGGLAVANGHITFGTEDGILYCFGFPVDL